MTLHTPIKDASNVSKPFQKEQKEENSPIANVRGIKIVNASRPFSPSQLNNTDPDPLIGIDIGTSSICVGIFDKDSNAVTILDNIYCE